LCPLSNLLIWCRRVEKSTETAGYWRPSHMTFAEHVGHCDPALFQWVSCPIPLKCSTYGHSKAMVWRLHCVTSWAPASDYLCLSFAVFNHAVTLYILILRILHGHTGVCLHRVRGPLLRTETPWSCLGHVPGSPWSRTWIALVTYLSRTETP
jgi:hypothetical protein